MIWSRGCRRAIGEDGQDRATLSLPASVLISDKLRSCTCFVAAGFLTVLFWKIYFLAGRKKPKLVRPVVRPMPNWQAKLLKSTVSTFFFWHLKITTFAVVTCPGRMLFALKSSFPGSIIQQEGLHKSRSLSPPISAISWRWVRSDIRNYKSSRATGMMKVRVWLNMESRPHEWFQVSLHFNLSSG